VRLSMRSGSRQPSSSSPVIGSNGVVICASSSAIAYVTGPEFPEIANAFVDVLVKGPSQQRAFARPDTAAK
jgi:hypothetical protein